MIDTIYITATRYKILKMAKTQPDTLAKEERVAAIKIEFPDEMFTEIPLPIIKIVLPGTQVGAASVTVDGQPQEQSITAAQGQQGLVQRMMAKMLIEARDSSDPTLRNSADDALRTLLDAGVKVRIDEDDAQTD